MPKVKKERMSGYLVMLSKEQYAAFVKWKIKLPGKRIRVWERAKGS
jgi:hypothetical protein